MVGIGIAHRKFPPNTQEPRNRPTRIAVIVLLGESSRGL